MSRDEKPSIRRPRPLGPPQWAPGARGQLHDYLYDLYLAAGEPTMRAIKQLVDNDDDAKGRPSKDTINRCLAGTELPQQADVLSRWRPLKWCSRSWLMCAPGSPPRCPWWTARAP
ncbi:hypothetical protein GCM10020256_39550 [Streptomyces thermocoprophilus]